MKTRPAVDWLIDDIQTLLGNGGTEKLHEEPTDWPHHKASYSLFTRPKKWTFWRAGFYPAITAI